MPRRSDPGRSFPSSLRLALSAFLLAAMPAILSAQSVPDQRSQDPAAAAEGEWRFWGADASSTRYSPLDQVHAGNFEDLQVAWRWRADNFGPSPDFVVRGTPTYADGRLFHLAGSRRAVVSIDAATGETLWVWRMPDNPRWAASPRQNYGKSVHYEVVDGRGLVFMTTPGFWLVALEAETGLPVEGWGGDGNGIVDLLEDLGDYPFDPWDGLEHGEITTSSGPIVVDGVIIVPSTGEQGYYQTRKENVPSNILAYDARTGEHLWRFHVIPRPGEYGHETWEDGAWEYTGNIGSWAPISADLERGIVYIVTKAGTNDYYGGHRPGDGLFGTSVIALDVHTGERIWHYQLVRHDIWNYDTPHAPQLVDITVDGEEIPALVVVTKQSFAYVFNRVTGEPVWPFEYRDVPQSDVPGERTSPVQPFPTRPAPFELQGLTVDDLVDYTPELRELALELLAEFRMGPLFNPPALPDEEEGIVASLHCPGANGGANIPGGAAVDPETGILYVASIKGCSAPRLVPGTEVNPDSNMRYVTRGPGGVGSVGGIPIFQPPYGRITAIDLNTGEHLWWIPNGDTPEEVRNHPLLDGVELGNTGQRSHATVLATSTLLMYGEGRGGEAKFRAVDKATGEEVGHIQIPAQTTTAPMTYLHEGRQYIVLPVAGSGEAAQLVALTLPDREE
jgi:glucose dehydrogenase